MGGSLIGRRLPRRGASPLLRGGITRPVPRTNRDYANPIAKDSVPVTVRDHTALALRRQAEQDATIGTLVVKCAACNFPITFFAGATVENSPQWLE